MIYIATREGREKKMKKVIFLSFFVLENTKRAFIDNPDVSLFTAPTCELSGLSWKRAHNNKLSPCMHLSLCLSLLHTHKYKHPHTWIRNSSTYDSLGSLVSRTGQMHKVMFCQGWWRRCWCWCWCWWWMRTGSNTETESL